MEPKLKCRALAPGIQKFLLQLQPSKFLTLAPEQFDPLKTKNNSIICTVGLLHKLCLLNGNSNFRLRLHHTIQNFLAPLPCSSSTALLKTNCFWKLITLFLQMQLRSFCLFVFCVNNCPFISLALKYFKTKIIFLPTLKS